MDEINTQGKCGSLVYANLFNSAIIYLQLMTDTNRWGKNMRYWYEYNIKKMQLS